MNKPQRLTILLGLTVATFLVACEPQSEQSNRGMDDAPADAGSGTTTEAGEAAMPATVAGDDSTAASKPAASSGAAGKPTAPIDIKYEVIGNAVVGRPVQINIEVTSAEGPVRVQYGITDASALSFQQGQLERLEIVNPAAGSLQQLTVMPHREGRLYVNVSAEVDTPSGSMIRSLAIPIKVGNAPEMPTSNGQLKEGPGGETVISLPAQETPRR